MITLDTNLLVRLLLRDDARQYTRVRQLLAQEQDFTAPVTVMLELVWVLEVNDCGAGDIVRGLKLLLGLPNFKPQQADALHQALQWYAQGIDFADALHLAQSGASEHMATFDKAFARKAGRLGAVPPVVAV
ncbi:MAG: type II toxin-antitoxin system VapC family toxin [Polaromonas sp.]|nr:type II toxin-antitoxin system VapC family toxin [Polaromonas sp.]